MTVRHLQYRYVEATIKSVHRLAVGGVVELRGKEVGSLIYFILHSFVNSRPSLGETTDGEMVETSDNG